MRKITLVRRRRHGHDCITAIKIDGEELDIVGGSDIILKAGLARPR